MEREDLKKLKNVLKKEITILRNEKDRLNEKIHNNNSNTVLIDLLLSIEKLINERKIKILAINKKEQLTDSNKLSILNDLNKKIENLLSIKGETIPMLDLINDKDFKNVLEQIKSLGYQNFEEYVKNNSSANFKIVNESIILKNSESLLNFNEHIGNENPSRILEEDKNIIIKILSDNRNQYLQGNEIIKKYKTITGKRLRIPGYENMKHFLDDIKGVDCSIRGYKLSKNFKVLNNLPKTKKIISHRAQLIDNFSKYKKFELMPLKSLMQENNPNKLVNIFLWKELDGKSLNWINELHEKEILDSKTVLAAIQKIEHIYKDKLLFNSLTKILEEMLTSMYKFEYPVSQRSQKLTIKILQNIENYIPGELKLAIMIAFKLQSLITSGEKRLYISNITNDSRLNWLLLDEDKKELLKRSRDVNSILERSVLHLSKNSENLNGNLIHFKSIIKNNKIQTEFCNEVNYICLIIFHQREEAIKFLNLDICKEYIFTFAKNEICVLFNSSVCIKNRTCHLRHICAWCGKKEHNLYHCLKYNK